MTIHIHFIAETPVKLWGLSSRERARRVFKNIGITTFVDDLKKVPPTDSVLLLRGDYLYDNRILNGLVAKVGLVLRSEAINQLVSAHVPARLALDTRIVLLGAAPADVLGDITAETPATLCAGHDLRLRKFDKPLLSRVRSDNRALLEKRLFRGAYKGITDLVTKWVWPAPARGFTRICAKLGVKPNHVTGLSWVLAVLAGALFAYGFYGWGLVAGWLMTFLDTVDGKLARVTITYTRFGNFFDHALDMVHPPFWYLAWGLGLAVYVPGISGLSLSATVWLIFVAYIGSRLIEKTFSKGVAGFSIFTWRPIDSYSRLITARRNPCLILLTVSALAGRPDFGLLAVAVWTLGSTLFLSARLAMAYYSRRNRGPLHSWLTQIDDQVAHGTLASRWFVR